MRGTTQYRATKDNMNAIDSSPENSSEKTRDPRIPRDPEPNINSTPLSAKEALPKYTKLHFSGDPVTTSYITCSHKAAEYAYLHYATPYLPEWRAASAGYDAGCKATAEAQPPIPDPTATRAVMNMQGLWVADVAEPGEIAEWPTVAVGTPIQDSTRVHTQCKLCDCLDGAHLISCPENLR